MHPLSILFLVGSLVGFAAAVFMAVLSYIYLSHKRISWSWFLAAAYLALGILYFLMLVDFFPHQRSDSHGTEFPVYRGGFEVVITLMLASVVSELTAMQKHERATYILVSVISFIALAIANFCLPNQFWYGWGACIVMQLFCQFWIWRTAAKKSGLSGWLGWFAVLCWSFAVPLVQALSWTMGKILDTPPKRINSEIAYVVIYFAGVSFVALAWFYHIIFMTVKAHTSKAQ